MNLYKKIIDYSIFFILIIYALYLCIINNYGWDWDTYAMIETFLDLKDDGNYKLSRGAGYLIPEIGFGFLAYYFGSNITNTVTFVFLILALIFFYKAAAKIKNIDKNNSNNLILFIALCLSNHIIIRDSTIPIDYSWSFLFYSIGLYTLVNKKYEISILFFALCFGSRFNFIAFIVPTIFFIDSKFINLKQKIINIFIIVFFGCLFYVPSWLQNQFALDFIYSEQSSFKTNSILSIEELSRFTYKVLKTFGILSLIFIAYIFFKFKKKILEHKYFFIIVSFNLIVFFIFPWEPSFLWLTIITLFFVIIKSIDFKLIYFLVFLNLLNWFFQVEIVKIRYDINNCFKKPVSANLKFHLSKGLVLDQNNRLKQILCYPDLLGSGKKIMKYKDRS